MSPIADFDSCPCGMGTAYSRCCGALHRAGHAGLGTSADATMRARYSAYVVGDEAFLLATWHPTTRPASLDFNQGVEWHGLTVDRVTGGGVLDTTGTVEFHARFRRGDAHITLHELSTFRHEGGRWFYVDGIDPDSA